MLLQDPNKCRHCGGKMSAPKPVLTGPRQGQTKRVCFKCGHIDYYGQQPGQLPPEYVERHRDELGLPPQGPPGAS